MLGTELGWGAWQWGLALLGGLLVGLSKTGIAGLGGFAVAIFANLIPARESTGVILPLLICADVVAVLAYRRHAVWSHLWKLFPWVVPGILIGYVTMKHLDSLEIKRIIGLTLVVIVVIHLWRNRGGRAASPSPRHVDSTAEGVSHGWWFAALTGLFAGFTTMVANAAGPIMILYLLAVRLPKMEFLGTGAWYFLLLNTFKVPFSLHLDLINPSSLRLDLYLIPAVLLGAFSGRAVIGRINQLWFERLAFVLTLLAGIHLMR